MVQDREYKHLTLNLNDGVLSVRLNRPEVHNALNGELVRELTDCFRTATEREHVRAVLLSGVGHSFCAGADLRDMRAAAWNSYEANLRDAQSLWDMFEVIDRCPLPTIARVHGNVLGGGMGLVACCDAAIASSRATFGFTEAKLGILPAVISPFVLSKIGGGNARWLFTTAQRFDASLARQIGLVHLVVQEDELDSIVNEQIVHIRTSAPGSVSEAKRLIGDLRSLPPTRWREYTTETIARLRAGEEGREGISAFLEKRRPSWIQD